MKVCVTGCERSGTSAVANLLHLGSGWSLLDDPPAAWYVTPLAALTGGGLTPALWWKLRRHRIVKVPCFAAILPYLRRRAVGRFHTIHCVRDPRDNVASLLERFDNGAPGMAFDVHWLRVPAGSLIEALAWRWRKLLEYAEQDRDAGGRVTFVRYEDFCADKLAVVRGLADRCAMPFDASRVAAHLDRQFRKRWADRIAGPQRWRTDLTESQTRTIEDLCGPLMARWGYDAAERAAA